MQSIYKKKKQPKTTITEFALLSPLPTAESDNIENIFDFPVYIVRLSG